MENATQALFIAATVLVFVIIVSFAVWMFGATSAIGQSYELQMSELEIQKHNSQFSEFNKKPKFINKSNKNDIQQYSTSVTNPNYVLYEFNSISDVISAINKAYSINAKKNYDILPGVQVTISGLNNIENEDLESFKKIADINMRFDYYGISPLYQKLYHDKKESDKNCIYNLDKNTKIMDSPSSLPTEKTEINNLLKFFNQDNKLVNGVDGKVRAYKYVFKGEVKINENTGLIDVINFTCIKNNVYEYYE